MREERTRKWLANSPDKMEHIDGRGRPQKSVVEGWTEMLEKVSRGEASSAVIQLDSPTKLDHPTAFSAARTARSDAHRVAPPVSPRPADGVGKLAELRLKRSAAAKEVRTRTSRSRPAPGDMPYY